jgi:hypothetical protein
VTYFIAPIQINSGASLECEERNGYWRWHNTWCALFDLWHFRTHREIYICGETPRQIATFLAVYNDLFQEKSPIKLSDRSVNTDSAEAQSSNNELSQFFPVLHYTNSYFNRLQSTSDKAQLEKFQSFISVIKSSPWSQKKIQDLSIRQAENKKFKLSGKCLQKSLKRKLKKVPFLGTFLDFCSGVGRCLGLLFLVEIVETSPWWADQRALWSPRWFMRFGPVPGEPSRGHHHIRF